MAHDVKLAKEALDITRNAHYQAIHLLQADGMPPMAAPNSVATSATEVLPLSLLNEKERAVSTLKDIDQNLQALRSLRVKQSRSIENAIASSGFVLFLTGTLSGAILVNLSTLGALLAMLAAAVGLGLLIWIGASKKNQNRS